jgi:hypothetical protein
LQRREENRVAAFSQWTLAMYAWNKEEMEKGVPYPGKNFWKQLLVCLPIHPLHVYFNLHPEVAPVFRT